MGVELCMYLCIYGGNERVRLSPYVQMTFKGNIFMRAQPYSSVRAQEIAIII